MIRVSGMVNLSVKYNVQLNISEEDFDKLSENRQNVIIEEAIDWHNELRNAETEDIEVWDIDEV